MKFKQVFQFLKKGIEDSENHKKTYKSGYVNGFSMGVMIGSIVMGVFLVIDFIVMMDMIP